MGALSGQFMLTFGRATKSKDSEDGDILRDDSFTETAG